MHKQMGQLWCSSNTQLLVGTLPSTSSCHVHSHIHTALLSLHIRMPVQHLPCPWTHNTLPPSHSTIQTPKRQLSALETELEEFAGHEVIRAILEQGVVIQQHSADVGGRLRALELESIQDYIAESDNLVALHEQVRGLMVQAVAVYMPSTSRRAISWWRCMSRCAL